MGRLIQIAASTLLSGGILNHGSLGGYISNATRLALGMGLAELQDGQVHYFSRHHDLLKRAAIQVASQTAYGLLRSYPRYLKYWEQQVRDKYLQTQSQSSLANKTGQYYQLIREQQAVAQKKNHIDSIVGRTVADFLELSISEEGKYYDNSECKVFAEQPVWTGDIRGPGTAGTGQQPEQYPADPGTGAGLYPQGIYIRG